MAREITRSEIESPSCGYLPDRPSSTDFRVLLDVTPAEYEAMLERGWRRFGPEYFRPICAGCAQCVSLRVPAKTFQPTNSQRRAFKKCQDLKLVVGEPQMDEQRVELYHKWHANREAARGWEPSQLDYQQYFIQFCFPHPCAHEFAYYLAGKLVGIGLVDETPNALSLVYFYYDPDCRRLSLGVFSVLMALEIAKARGLEHVYLGYRVRDCPSVAYKGAYRPHELLVGRPGANETPKWVSEERFSEPV